jgi:hypothetical protein
MEFLRDGRNDSRQWATCCCVNDGLLSVYWLARSAESIILLMAQRGTKNESATIREVLSARYFPEDLRRLWRHYLRVEVTHVDEVCADTESAADLSNIWLRRHPSA